MVMNDMLRKLPIGIQTFEDLRTGNCLYVDKTAFIWKIANTGKPYFLNVPAASVGVCCFLLSRLTSEEERISLKDLPLNKWRQNGKSILCCILI